MEVVIWVWKSNWFFFIIDFVEINFLIDWVVLMLKEILIFKNCKFLDGKSFNEFKYDWWIVKF